jgi:hypothetical protein
MKRPSCKKKSKTPEEMFSPLQAQFPLSDVCGCWVSDWNSPGIKIFRHGRRYRLTYTYDSKTAFTVPIRQSLGITFFDLYGRMTITYDSGQDRLLLSTEGAYRRADDGC